MIAFGRRAVRVYRAADRIVARPGEPTSFEVFLARRPLVVALGAGAPLSALFAATALPGEEWGGVFFGSAFGVAYGLMALGERGRQREAGYGSTVDAG
ncbi:hypothetical protein [Streptomyces alkaliphilus]|uniref:hypothetical protein n=1 Tax=Streptomyces alkaliphilus TaxID=1472722 RepID=UPI00117DB227|nr:hypothetical protein [Streptomyces alkaliphilus]MQS08445.1 hypothetical protein [Streptomyces alkaliphilus]